MRCSSLFLVNVGARGIGGNKMIKHVFTILVLMTGLDCFATNVCIVRTKSEKVGYRGSIVASCDSQNSDDFSVDTKFENANDKELANALNELAAKGYRVVAHVLESQNIVGAEFINVYTLEK